MAGTTILVVSADFTTLQQIIKACLDQGWNVIPARRLIEGLQWCRSHWPDLFVLDLDPVCQLDHLDPVETVRLIHSTFCRPVIVLAQRNSDPSPNCSRVEADDVLLYPLQLGEFLTCAQKLLSQSGIRPPPQPTAPIAFYVDDDVILSSIGRQVFVQGKKIPLSQREFDLCCLLITYAGQLVPLATIRDYLQHRNGQECTLTALRLCIMRLRLKMEPDPRHPRYILSKRNTGYLYNKQGSELGVFTD